MGRNQARRRSPGDQLRQGNRDLAHWHERIHSQQKLSRKDRRHIQSIAIAVIERIKRDLWHPTRL